MASNFGQKLRPSAVAGQFYPEEKKELGKMIDGFLAQAKPQEIKGEVFGLILPHAGYVFSGPVAAFGIKTIAGKDFDTVIIIGDSHYEYFDGVSVWPEGFWETPLGRVEVDKDLANKILSDSDRFLIRDSAHLFEHSLEVQIPLLQKTLRDFKILPIIFGSEDKDWKILAKAILENIRGKPPLPKNWCGDKKVLIIASSDFSHYPSYEKAKEVDPQVLGAVLTLDPQKLEEKIRVLEEELIPNVQTFLCAKDSVKTMMEIARILGAKAKLLKYTNSGDTSGNKSRVVGYGAVAVYEKKKEGEGVLTQEEKEELLRIAKTSVESQLAKSTISGLGVKSERLKEHRGAFVTLKRGGRLRGCIGQMMGDQPLYEVVSQMAIAAALEDPRFTPVSVKELPELEYEISALSPFRQISSLKEIQLGIHGVQIIAGNRTGLFLPQVATENNWDLETFLDNLMLKAGLSPDYWRNHPADFYVFEAEVFGENAR